MTLARSPFLAAPLAFAAMLAVLVLLMGAGRDDTGGPAADAAARRAAPDAPSAGASTDERIRILQATVRAAPRRADGYVLLAGAYAQKVRETGDAAFYAKADAVFETSGRTIEEAHATLRAQLEPVTMGGRLEPEATSKTG